MHAIPLRQIVFIILMMIPLVALAGDDPTASKPRELVFLNWSEYMDSELVREFEQQFNAKIKFIYFEADEMRDTMMLENDGEGYDLAIVDGIKIDRYRNQGWLAPLDISAIPNFKHINVRWSTAFAAAEGYGVPYFWGTLGIAYRADLVPEKITRWMQLFKPAESLRGKIVMLKDSIDMLGIALKALGYSLNSTDPKAMAEAEALLMAQKPFVKRYSYVSLSEQSGLVTGEIAAAMIYSGDALMIREHHPEIISVLPEEGGSLWVDYIVIPAASNNKDLSHAFINFINEPENAARLAQYVYYPTPNKAAEILLPKEFLQNPNIYPPQSVIDRSEFSKELPPRALKQRNTIFTRVLQE